MDALKSNPNVQYAQGYDVKTEEPDEALILEAVEAAKHAEVAVIVAGLPDAFESEGYDRTRLDMPKCQNILIERVAQANPNTVVVLYNGAPILMPWLQRVKGVVEGYLGGQAVGSATADVLFGRVNPSGKLPETFPKRLEDTPCYLTYGGEKDHAVYSEGVFVGYRYYDKRRMDVLFPFGFGLSYTKFAYSNLVIDKKSIRDDEPLTVSADVQNVGSVPGKEVVQLYVGDRESTVFRPERELKGFKKLALAPGEKKTVIFTLDQRAFAYWNETLHDWHVETGEFTIEIGGSSRDLPLSGSVTVQSTVAIPETFTLDSIFMDLMTSEKAMRVLAPLLEGMKQAFSGGDDDAAISGEMMQAMIRYMPLRGLMMFAPGQVTYDQLLGILDEINR